MNLKSIFKAVAVLVLGLVCGYIAFGNLGSQSILIGDEYAHVQASQSIIRGAPVWLPTVGGQTYVHKPPFKIALSALVASILGESNFSFRFLDAVAGLGTALLIYFIALRIWGSHLIGSLAVLALFGCYNYIFVHGIRHALQDSLLVFLSTAALFVFRELCLLAKDTASTPSLSRSRTFLLASLFGLLTGCSVLTKSVAGLISPFITFLFLIARGGWRSSLRQLRFPLAVAVLVCLVFCLFYIVPLLISVPAMFGYIIDHQMLSRITGDSGSSSALSYYFQDLFIDQTAFPPLLLGCSLIYSVWALYDKGSEDLLYLLIWAVSPVVLYSFAATRYSWYIAPAYPAMALLLGYFIHQLFCYAGSSRRLFSLIAALILIGSLIMLGNNILKVITKVSRPGKPILFQSFAEEMSEYNRVYDGRGKLLFLKTARDELALNEAVYFDTIEPFVVTIINESQVQRALFRKRIAFSLSNARKGYALMRLRKPVKYLPLPSYYNRSRYFVVLAFTDKTLSPLFKSFETDLLIDFISKTGLEPNITSTLPLTHHFRGDYMMKRLGGNLELVLQCDEEFRVAPVELRLNGETLSAEWEQLGAKWLTNVKIGDNKFSTGNNAVQLISKGCKNSEVRRLRLLLDISKPNLKRATEQVKPKRS